MRLNQLVKIRQNFHIPNNLMLSVRPASGNFVAVLKADNLLKGSSVGKFISEKDLRKLNSNFKASLLEYGNYMVAIETGIVKIVRHDKTEATIPSDDLYIISDGLSTFENYLSYPQNSAYVIRSIQEHLEANPDDIIGAIGKVEINIDDITELEEDNLSEQLGIRKPLDKSVLPFRLTDKPIPLDKLMKRIERGRLILDSDFQRRPGLWDIDIKSRLIEAMIVRLPIPAFYFDGSNDEEWLVIDGLQRLSAIRDFLDGKYALTALDYLRELEGKKFDELEETYQTIIEESVVFAYILEKGTPKSVIHRVFKNINTSALRLEGQEIRHAINPGKPATQLKETSEEAWFKAYVPLSDRQRERMYDREIILRFITFKRHPYRTYMPSMSDFLDDAMEDLYDIPKQKLGEYVEELQKITFDIYDTFGEAAFSRSVFDDSKTIYKHNNILFELLTYAFSKNRQLSLQKEESRSLFKSFFQEKPSSYWDNEQAYSQSGLIRRFEDIEKLISKIK